MARDGLPRRRAPNTSPHFLLQGFEPVASGSFGAMHLAAARPSPPLLRVQTTSALSRAQRGNTVKKTDRDQGFRQRAEGR